MFVCDPFEFYLMVVTLLSLFQTLLKETEAIENIHVDAVIGNHPDGAVDAEVTRIASEHSVNLDGVEATETVPRHQRTMLTQWGSQRCDLVCVVIWCDVIYCPETVCNLVDFYLTCAGFAIV
jgi:gamma-glutamylcyclotransferase (GGCT)/AIG2-like uncharacterized protein YtfP